MSELDIETQILDWLASLGIGFFWKNTSGGFHDGKRWRQHQSKFAIRGTSDILGLVNGRFIALEVKTTTGVVSSEQKAFIQKVRECGGFAAVVRSVRQTEELFEEWGLCAPV
jgi:hypothetical protein